MKAAKERIAKETGIRGLPGLHRVGSLDYARSAPWEWFHILLENIIPNLVDLWTGQFKGLDIGDNKFKIAPHIWEAIGEETAVAVLTESKKRAGVAQSYSTLARSKN